MSDYRELLLGCGFARTKCLVPPGRPKDWVNLHTADINPAAKPDYLINLDRENWSYAKDLNEAAIWQLPADHFDEVHAYEVLEHLGQQGDVASFFSTFHNIWRILKPDGLLCATTPSRFSAWLWGDPGHRRAILPESLAFLDRSQYTKQLGLTAMSDYRHLYRGDFSIVENSDDRSTHRFILRAHKPMRT